jgi:hypothetical protein
MPLCGKTKKTINHNEIVLDYAHLNLLRIMRTDA